MKKIEDYFIQLGLSDIESKLYLGLLEKGKCTIMELSNYTNIKRITAHFNVESLVNKGLVSETRIGAKRFIVPENPDRLSYLVEQKLEQGKKLSESLPEMLKLIQAYTPKNESSGEKSTDVRYYEGKKAVKLLYSQILKAKKIYSFANINKIKKVFPENTELFRKSLEKNEDQEMWEILEDSRESRKKSNDLNPRYYYRFIPQSTSFSNIDIIIFDNSIALIHLEDNPSAVVNYSKDMADGLRAIHKIVWSILSTN